MSTLFDDIVSQHLDLNGKVRIINYKNVSLAISPLPPFDVPEVEKSEIHIATIKNALIFTKEKNLTIVEQDGNVDDQSIQGLWITDNLSQAISFGYIPIKVPEQGNNAVKDIPFSDLNLVDPVFTGSSSELETSRHNAKIAEYLKEYSIYEWSQNPDDFDHENYVVIPNHVYQLDNLDKLKFSTQKNTVFYKKDKLIVPDKETIDRLLMFVRVSYLNDSFLAHRYKNKKNICSYKFYSSINDFRPIKNQLVFIGRTSITQWKKYQERASVRNQNYVLSYTLPDTKEPYYYRNDSIKQGKLMIIQNVEYADFESALKVSKIWENTIDHVDNTTISKLNLSTRINVGYYISNIPSDIKLPDYPSFKVYTEQGLSHKSDQKPIKNDDGDVVEPRMHIFGYKDGRYAAVLFL